MVFTIAIKNIPQSSAQYLVSHHAVRLSSSNSLWTRFGTCFLTSAVGPGPCRWLRCISSRALRPAVLHRARPARHVLPVLPEALPEEAAPQ